MLSLVLLPLLCSLSLSASIPSNIYSPLIPQKLLSTASTFDSTYPQYTSSSGQWQFFSVNTWTSGFFPSTLYAMNKRQELCPQSSGSGTNWVQLGRSWTGPLQGISVVNTVEHDVGFISYPFQDELVVNPSNQTAKTIIKNLASELAARYSPIVGCTRSWDSADPTDFQVIIDNMMNLQLLFASNALSSNQTLVNIAVSHADKTMLNHIRPDGSSFHVVDYNSTTGIVFDRRTSQGFADNSTWSRGQAWGIYGFATMYQNTNMERYLDTARRMATYFLAHTPASGIIPWDFNAPTNPLVADSSAAMIATNAYLLLSTLESSVGNSTGASIWSNAATKLISNTVNTFWKPSWQSLLSNGTVNKPAGNQLTGIVYGDYYLLKAGNTMVDMGLAGCS